MWAAREIERLLQGRLRLRPVVVLTGARQTGKTSLVRRLFASWEYVSLDSPYPLQSGVQALPLESADWLLGD